MHGFTPNYIRVELPAEVARAEFDNQILTVRMTGFNRDKSALLAQLIG